MVDPYLFFGIIAFLVLTLALLAVSLYYNYKHGRIILRVIDGIENSLDVLDEKYGSVSEILNVPLFYDSPQIRQVHSDLESCRDTILSVASLIGSVDVISEEDKAE